MRTGSMTPSAQSESICDTGSTINRVEPMRRTPLDKDERDRLIDRDPRCHLCKVELDSTRCVAVSIGAQPTRGLDKALRKFRTKECGDSPAYIVMTNRSIEEIVESLPDSSEKLLDIHGMGKIKVDKYGTQILQIVSEHRASADSLSTLEDIRLVCVDCRREENRHVRVPEGVLNVLAQNGIGFTEAVQKGLSYVIRDLEG